MGKVKALNVFIREGEDIKCFVCKKVFVLEGVCTRMTEGVEWLSDQKIPEMNLLVSNNNSLVLDKSPYRQITNTT